MKADTRINNVTDMVTGIRTIKCYGWENHYIKKIKQVRDEQVTALYKFNNIATFGWTFFQNVGLIVILIIFLSEWSQGKALN